jgi:membrane associated rhomboid family serine protease
MLAFFIAFVILGAIAPFFGYVSFGTAVVVHIIGLIIGTIAVIVASGQFEPGG